MLPSLINQFSSILIKQQQRFLLRTDSEIILMIAAVAYPSHPEDLSYPHELGDDFHCRFIIIIRYETRGIAPRHMDLDIIRTLSSWLLLVFR